MCKREIDEVESEIAEHRETLKTCASQALSFEAQTTQLLEEKKACLGFNLLI